MVNIKTGCDAKWVARSTVLFRSFDLLTLNSTDVLVFSLVIFFSELCRGRLTQKRARGKEHEPGVRDSFACVCFFSLKPLEKLSLAALTSATNSLDFVTYTDTTPMVPPKKPMPPMVPPKKTFGRILLQPNTSGSVLVSTDVVCPEFTLRVFFPEERSQPNFGDRFLRKAS